MNHVPPKSFLSRILLACLNLREFNDWIGLNSYFFFYTNYELTKLFLFMKIGNEAFMEDWNCHEICTSLKDQ